MKTKSRAITSSSSSAISSNNKSIKSAKMIKTTRLKWLIASVFLQATIIILFGQQTSYANDQQQSLFPGVTRDLASFCAARPSLPIDLASMIVHVKKNTSFNYKLYLFSADHVFQTGQVIPRADFRIHSFPVKIKHISEFWPSEVATLKYTSSKLDSLVSVPSYSFSLRQFLKQVPLYPAESPSSASRRPKTRSQVHASDNHHKSVHVVDLHGDPLPGDHLRVNFRKSSPTTTTTTRDEDANKHIRFDRDDQLQTLAKVRLPGQSEANGSGSEASSSSMVSEEFAGDTVIPVGAFSSFHVNLTYLVRKDFDQQEPQIIRIQVDANNFTVTQVHLISNGSQALGSYPQVEDYNFLSHKLIRDPNTRITAINQIYEEWITRNYYTIVYVQRRLNADTKIESETDSDATSKKLPRDFSSPPARTLIVNDRLVFRGPSTALIGADQLDYSVKAAAFITEKNGLHYYLEFLKTNKFHLCAVDWSRRPFKMIDSRRFPIKATKTQLDNEELLLCPPAVCFSQQPVDEVVSYGRMDLNEKLQQEVTKLLISNQKGKFLPSLSSQLHAGDLMPSIAANEAALVYDGTEVSGESISPRVSGTATSEHSSSRQDTEASSEPEAVDTMDQLSDKVKAVAGQLETKLHLRDWTWTLARKFPRMQPPASSSPAAASNRSGNLATVAQFGFEWRYELARRNDIKAKQDSYGFALTGHEVDASYRVYNELYLISANHLISINYTLANETVTSSHPIGEEFYGLSSTLIDPITGAFYDRYTNQIYFFKGDRYIGYDFATKKPLEDFQLQAPSGFHDPMALASFTSGESPLVSSLPVVNILGRQHHVDAIYHDFSSDLVHIFTGMKFYTFEARHFKNGIFKTETDKLPELQCINMHFLSGCHFDVAYPNPCEGGAGTDEANDTHDANKFGGDDQALDGKDKQQGAAKLQESNEVESTGEKKKVIDFTEEQQMKLRSIAARGGLLDILVENTLLNNKGAAKIIDSAQMMGSQPQDKVIIYLLVAMVGLTLLVTIAMIFVLVNWTKMKADTRKSSLHANDGFVDDHYNGQSSTTRSSGGNSIGSRHHRHHYLANQQHQYQQSRSHPVRAHSRQLQQGYLVGSQIEASILEPQLREKSIGSAMNQVASPKKHSHHQRRKINALVDSSVL